MRWPSSLTPRARTAVNWSMPSRPFPEKQREGLAVPDRQHARNGPQDARQGLPPEQSQVRLSPPAEKRPPGAAISPWNCSSRTSCPTPASTRRRNEWRKDFYDRFLPIAKECSSPGEAVKRLNVEVFKIFNVAYHATKRPKPDQSPYESIQAGFASCTGLSILLIDTGAGGRGIPARMVGTPRWTDNSGKETIAGSRSWDREWFVRRRLRAEASSTRAGSSTRRRRPTRPSPTTGSTPPRLPERASLSRWFGTVRSAPCRRSTSPLATSRGATSISRSSIPRASPRRRTSRFALTATSWRPAAASRRTHPSRSPAGPDLTTARNPIRPERAQTSRKV